MGEMFRFVVLAAALGLAAGMLLGGVALLLAAPARAQAAGPRPAVEWECLPAPRPAVAPMRIET